ncbi:hypothetical protein AVEN_180153-1 [Araneus ventricosus]|uniref:Uncharacterized protein n=1 Tax=Araneus ventricosus TaxID=182803 RepID=A0A4Y2D688_ARAVE|nr:hypothetical protein AVEN_180153-1 [Araneus ventricosus]
MSYFSAHNADVSRKSATGKIVPPQPAELRCSCKRIPSYEAGTKRPNVPCALRKMKQKFKTTGQLGILPGRGRKQIPSTSVEDVAIAVVETSSQSPHGSDRDSEVRTTFALEFLARMMVEVTWPWNILWSNEAHFCLNGHVNTHNCRIWAAENPHAIQEQPLHPDKVTICSGFKATFIIEPYFFEEITANRIQTCSVTGQRYRDMLRDFVIPKLQQRGCLQDIIFMQDGAPPHVV